MAPWWIIFDPDHTHLGSSPDLVVGQQRDWSEYYCGWRNHENPVFVGIYRGIIIPGILRWCNIFSHTQYGDPTRHETTIYKRSKRRGLLVVGRFLGLRSLGHNQGYY